MEKCNDEIHMNTTYGPTREVLGSEQNPVHAILKMPRMPTGYGHLLAP